MLFKLETLSISVVNYEPHASVLGKIDLQNQKLFKVTLTRL